MKAIYALCSIFWLSIGLSAQGRFDGLWEGKLTYGGIHSEQSYRFQLWLQTDGGSLKGRSYVYLTPEQAIEMEVQGTIYSDMSLYLLDVEFIPAAGHSLIPAFYRKYQMVFKRSIWETALEGYWQQILDSPMEERRERGRIQLQKVKTMKP